MYATDFDRPRGSVCELCPAPITPGQRHAVCQGCESRRVHVWCLAYAYGDEYRIEQWCCSNCKDGRPKRPLDPNLSLRSGSTRTRKAPDVFQIVDTRPTITRKRSVTPLVDSGEPKMLATVAPPVAHLVGQSPDEGSSLSSSNGDNPKDDKNELGVSASTANLDEEEQQKRIRYGESGPPVAPPSLRSRRKAALSAAQTLNSIVFDQ